MKSKKKKKVKRQRDILANLCKGYRQFVSRERALPYHNVDRAYIHKYCDHIWMCIDTSNEHPFENNLQRIQHREVYQLLCEWLLEHMNSRLSTIEWPCDIGYDAYVVVRDFNTRFVCDGIKMIMRNPPIKKVFPFEIRQCSNILPEVLLNVVLDYMELDLE